MISEYRVSLLGLLLMPHYSKNRYYELYKKLLGDIPNLRTYIQTEGGVDQVAKHVRMSHHVDAQPKY